MLTEVSICQYCLMRCGADLMITATAGLFSNVATWASLTLLALSVGVYSLQARELVKQRKEFVKQTDEFVRQTNHSIDINRAILSQNINGMMNKISSLFFEHPELRQYFYDNANLPDDDFTQTRVTILAEMFIDFMSMTLTNEILAPIDETSAWATYFSDIAKSSPAIRSYWELHHQWYEGALQALLNPIMNEHKQFWTEQ